MTDATLTVDEIHRIEKVICPTCSELCVVAGMTNVEVAAWARSHPDCTLTVVFADKPSPIDIARALFDSEN